MGWEGYLPRSELIEWLPPKAKRYQYRPPPSVGERPFTPRIGAFEIAIQLIGPSAHATCGAKLVFSKLATGSFPDTSVFIELHRQAHKLICDAHRPGGSAFNSMYGESAARAIERSLSIQVPPSEKPPLAQLCDAKASKSAAAMLRPRLANVSFAD